MYSKAPHLNLNFGGTIIAVKKRTVKLGNINII
jgi:hypothetical protein